MDLKLLKVLLITMFVSRVSLQSQSVLAAFCSDINDLFIFSKASVNKMGHMTLHGTSCKEGLLFSEWAEKHKNFLVYQSETRTAVVVWNDVPRGSSTPA